MTLVSTRAGKESYTEIIMTKLKRLSQETLKSAAFQPELGTFYFDDGENEHLTSRHLVGIHANWVNKELHKGLVVALQVKLLLCPDQSMIYKTLAKFLGKRKTTESQLMTFVRKAFALECPPLGLNLEYIDENNQPRLDTCFEECVGVELYQMVLTCFSKQQRLLKVSRALTVSSSLQITTGILMWNYYL